MPPRCALVCSGASCQRGSPGSCHIPGHPGALGAASNWEQISSVVLKGPLSPLSLLW